MRKIIVASGLALNVQLPSTNGPAPTTLINAIPQTYDDYVEDQDTYDNNDYEGYDDDYDNDGYDDEDNDDYDDYGEDDDDDLDNDLDNIDDGYNQIDDYDNSEQQNNYADYDDLAGPEPAQDYVDFAGLPDPIDIDRLIVSEDARGDQPVAVPKLAGSSKLRFWFDFAIACA